MKRRLQKPRAAAKSARKPARKAAARAAKRAVAAGGDPLDALIATGGRALGVKIEPGWMPAVRGHLEVTLRHGAAVTAFALPDEFDPAPVFRA